MRAALACLAVLLSGCAAPIQATRDLPQPRTLDEVNALLTDRSGLTVTLADGTRLTRASGVVVPADTIRFDRGGSRAAFSVGRVERITYVRNRGTRAGVAVGAAPGLLMGLAGAGIYLTAGSSDYPVGAVIGAALLGAAGGALALVGGPLGSVVGSAVSPGGIVTLYEAPVERYLPPGDGVSPLAPAAR